jgi:hypothetical protein
MQCGEVVGPTCTAREFLRHRTSFRCDGRSAINSAGYPTVGACNSRLRRARPHNLKGRARARHRIVPEQGTALLSWAATSIPCRALAMTYTQRYDLGILVIKRTGRLLGENERGIVSGRSCDRSVLLLAPLSYAGMLTSSARRRGLNRLHQGGAFVAVCGAASRAARPKTFESWPSAFERRGGRRTLTARRFVFVTSKYSLIHSRVASSPDVLRSASDDSQFATCRFSGTLFHQRDA